MNFDIQKLLASDKDEWAAMRLRLWDDLTAEQNMQEVERYLRDSNYTVYMVRSDKKQAIGFAEVNIRDYANGCTQQPVPFLEGIWIDPDLQRHGIGQKLIEHISDSIRAQGFCELCSDILETNQSSHKAHQKWGFEETERVIYFRKALN